MKLTSVGQRALIVLITAVTLAATGCNSNPPVPQPDRVPRYEQEPRDLCERSDAVGIANRYDLRIDQNRDLTGKYLDLGAYWEARCRFAGIVEEDRFATTTDPFSPVAITDLRVYKELADAESAYKSQADLFRRRDEREGPEVTATSPEGWWDESVKLVKRLDPPADLVQHPDAATIFDIRYVIRHDNLIILSGIGGVSQASAADQAMTLLEDLLEALMEENVSHLVRSD